MTFLMNDKIFYTSVHKYFLYDKYVYVVVKVEVVRL